MTLLSFSKYPKRAFRYRSCDVSITMTRSAHSNKSALTQHSASALVPAELTSIRSKSAKIASAVGLRRRFLAQTNKTRIIQPYPIATGSLGIGLALHFQFSRPCVPSQNGRLEDIPHRHSDIAGFPVKSHSFPSTSTSLINPSTRYGPFGR